MNKIYRKLGSRGGFSLIEMLVAMAIFMLFTGVLITSYAGVIRSLRGAEEYRVLYSEARHVFDVLTDTARSGTIFSPDCNDLDNGFASPKVMALEFCSKDRLSKTRFEYVAAGAGDERQLVMTEFVRGKVEDSFVEQEVELYSDEVRVTDFAFYVWPLRDPFAVGAEAELANLFHPKVTFIATFEKDSSKSGVYELDLQTSVCLRNL